jgi:hypothetical protein
MDFAADFYLSESQNPIPSPITHWLYILHFDTGKRGGGGRVEPERRLGGQQFTRLSQKYQQHDWLYLQSINSDKHLPQSPLLVNFFTSYTFLLLFSLCMQLLNFDFNAHQGFDFDAGPVS